jgi:hypothetical protein
MTVTLLHDDEIDIPVESQTFDAFRRWSSSDSFPQCGRIDYIDGRIEVDMSPDSNGPTCLIAGFAFVVGATI